MGASLPRRQGNGDGRDHRRVRTLVFGLEQELLHFLAIEGDQLGFRDRDVLHEWRRLEQLHEARERLDVDGVPGDLQLQRRRRRRWWRRRRLATRLRSVALRW